MCKYTIIPSSPCPNEHRVPLNPHIPLYPFHTNESNFENRGSAFKARVYNLCTCAPAEAGAGRAAGMLLHVRVAHALDLVGVEVPPTYPPDVGRAG